MTCYSTLIEPSSISQMRSSKVPFSVTYLELPSSSCSSAPEMKIKKIIMLHVCRRSFNSPIDWATHWLEGYRSWNFLWNTKWGFLSFEKNLINFCLPGGFVITSIYLPFFVLQSLKLAKPVYWKPCWIYMMGKMIPFPCCWILQGKLELWKSLLMQNILTTTTRVRETAAAGNA